MLAHRAFKPAKMILDPVRASPYGPAASSLPHHEAGQMTAPDHMPRAVQRNACINGGVHRCTTGSVVACPRSPWEGPARGATRPRRGWRRPARGRGLWAHGVKRGVIRTVAGVVTGGPKIRQLAPWVSHASPAASALTWALEIIGTALKSKEARVLPGSSLASLRWRSIRLRSRSASSCSTSAARKRAAVSFQVRDMARAAGRKSW